MLLGAKAVMAERHVRGSPAHLRSSSRGSNFGGLYEDKVVDVGGMSEIVTRVLRYGSFVALWEKEKRKRG